MQNNKDDTQELIRGLIKASCPKIGQLMIIFADLRG